MKKSKIFLVFLTMLILTIFLSGYLGITSKEILAEGQISKELVSKNELLYDDETKNQVPLTDEGKDLQTVIAEPYLKISDKGLQLEGPAFDRDNNLYIVEVYGGQIFKITPDKKISVVFPENKYGPAAIDIHKDGRLFVCGLGDFVAGSIFAINPDGTNFEIIIPESKGFLPDDMIFDKKGGFYFTDFNGYSTNPSGGVYYVYPPDYKKITKVLPNLSIANGIALSPDGKTLWITELGANRLHCVNLLDDGVTIAPFGATIPYYFTGNSGPDSMVVDCDGNLYIARYPQGRITVFNKNGFPIGQILIPGREEGKMLRTTSMAFKPGTNEMIITTNDWDGGGGSWIYTCKGFAKELPLYSHQE